MAAAEAAGEAAMLPGMIEVEAGIVARAGVVPDPFAVVVNVRSVGMAFCRDNVGGHGLGRRAMGGRRTMFGNISAAYGVAAASAVAIVLREAGKKKSEIEQEHCGEQSHEHLQEVTYHRRVRSNTALTILCRLRYSKDFGGRVVARLMAWRPR